MNLETWISEQEDSTLWALLADIGSVLGSRSTRVSTDAFWYQIAKAANDEIDRRLFIDGID